MKIGEKTTVMVAEPWDFESSMGKNVFSATICDYILTQYGDTYLIRSDEVLDIDSLKVSFMIITHRHKDISPNDFNIAYIPDEFVSQFRNFDAIENKLIQIIIGSVV